MACAPYRVDDRRLRVRRGLDSADDDADANDDVPRDHNRRGFWTGTGGCRSSPAQCKPRLDMSVLYSCLFITTTSCFRPRLVPPARLLARDGLARPRPLLRRRRPGSRFLELAVGDASGDVARSSRSSVTLWVALWAPRETG